MPSTLRCTVVGVIGVTLADNGTPIAGDWVIGTLGDMFPPTARCGGTVGEDSDAGGCTAGVPIAGGALTKPGITMPGPDESWSGCENGTAIVLGPLGTGCMCTWALGLEPGKRPAAAHWEV